MKNSGLDSSNMNQGWCDVLPLPFLLKICLQWGSGFMSQIWILPLSCCKPRISNIRQHLLALLFTGPTWPLSGRSSRYRTRCGRVCWRSNICYFSLIYSSFISTDRNNPPPPLISLRQLSLLLRNSMKWKEKKSPKNVTSRNYKVNCCLLFPGLTQSSVTVSVHKQTHLWSFLKLQKLSKWNLFPLKCWMCFVLRPRCIYA